jgi:hypothetical protein
MALFLIGWLAIGAAPALAQEQCPPNTHYVGSTREGNVRTIHCECDAGYKKTSDGACQAIVADPQCIKQAGERLQNERDEGCARVVGRCFQNNKTSLSAKAFACVAACRRVEGCAIGCGIAGLATEAIVATCVDEGTACFESALAKHRAAVRACNPS